MPSIQKKRYPRVSESIYDHPPKSEEYVATYTNNGRGERVEVRSLDSEDEKKYYFINRDLCEADALADFRLRQLRKSKDQFQ